MSIMLSVDTEQVFGVKGAFMICFNSRGNTGNIFVILGMAKRELRKQRRIADFNEMWERVQNAASYNEGLAIIREYVDLVDESGVF